MLQEIVGNVRPEKTYTNLYSIIELPVLYRKCHMERVPKNLLFTCGRALATMDLEYNSNYSSAGLVLRYRNFEPHFKPH